MRSYRRNLANGMISIPEIIARLDAIERAHADVVASLKQLRIDLIESLDADDYVC